MVYSILYMNTFGVCGPAEKLCSADEGLLRKGKGSVLFLLCNAKPCAVVFRSLYTFAKSYSIQPIYVVTFSSNFVVSLIVAFVCLLH